MIKKIVSGGQTGVDQAAFMAAEKSGISIGGWCPKGGLDENGICILNQYPLLQESSTVNPDERTRLNIRDSDGTLIIVPSWPLPVTIKDGTQLTIEETERQKKPYLIVSLTQLDHVTNAIRSWISIHKIKVLNIAGPRESSWPGIHDKACAFLRELFIILS